MDWWLLTFLIGAILSLFLPIVPEIFHVYILLIITLILFSHSKTRKSVGLLLGAAWLLLQGAQYQNIWLNNNINLAYLVNTEIEVRGEVANIASKKNDSKRFNFNISHLNGTRLAQSIRVRLVWKTAAFQPLQGQVWLLNIKMKPAHGFANPGGFSYQTWLRKNHIHASGYVLRTAENKLLDEKLSYRQLQYNLLQKHLASIKENTLSALVTALTFGEKGQLNQEHWHVLQATATQHLMAISGLHLGLIAGGSFMFAVILLRIIPISRLTLTIQYPLLRINNRVFAIIFSCILTLIYAYYAGFSVPTIRALLMISLLWIVKLSSIKLSVRRWLLLVVIALVIISPFSLFSSSFWLSFYAVSIIFIVFWRWKSVLVTNRSSRLMTCFYWCRSLLIIQLALTVMMLPLTIFLNYNLSLAAILANVIAVPFMSITAIPLSLLAVILMPINEYAASFILELSLACLSLLWEWLTYLTQIEGLMLSISSVELTVVISLIFILSTILFIGPPRRYILLICSSALLLCLVVFYPSYIKLPVFQQNDRQWQVKVMDVGQGLAVFIEVNGETMLYDTGASYPSGFNIAESVLIPYLKYQGENQLQALIISHDDNDHASGLGVLNRHFKVKRIIYNENTKGLSLSTEPCLQGQIINWQFLTIEQLWPKQVKANHNDDSCVLRISDGVNSVLFTGDISSKIERKLVAQYGVSESSKLKSTVLIAPHHGSKTSSSLSFIEAVKPDAVIFSAGYLNRWEMPVSSVVKRYRQAKVKTYNTANDGMVLVAFSNEEPHISMYRETVWPFWFAN